ncbi:MAG TPA: Crp/Fnr family transcriptional regulator [Bacillota bacterium]|nr:Crp/Fnr family transcriptional regulator [Bacillota bacterium]
MIECSHCNIQDTDQSCIAIVPIFSNLTHSEIHEIAMITTSREFKKGEIIHMAGDEADRLYVIHKGRAKITKLSEAGKEQIIRVLGPGDFLGELSLFIQTPLDSNAEALEDMMVCMIEGDRLKGIIGKNPTIAAKVIEELSRRLQGSDRLIESLGLHDVEQRVADVLLGYARDKDEIRLPLSKKDLSAHIGISQETLSRKLSLFEDMGLIKQSGHRDISIKNRLGLEEIVDLM